MQVEDAMFTIQGGMGEQVMVGKPSRSRSFADRARIIIMSNHAKRREMF